MVRKVYDLENYGYEYIKDLKKNNQGNEKLYNFITDLLNNSKNVSWESLCKQIQRLKELKIYGTGYIINLYLYLIEKGVYLGEYHNYIATNKWILDSETYKGSSFEESFFIGSNPKNIFIYKVGQNRRIIYLNIHDNRLRDILKDFLLHLQDIEYYDCKMKVFAQGFEESLSGNKLINISIDSFNEKTLEEQFRYYSMKQGRDKTICIKILKEFYTYLCERLGKDIFNISSGINKYYIQRMDFSTLYSDGYRVVYLNRADEISLYDKWLLSPNGYEEYTTTMKPNDFVVLNFSRVKSKKIRHELKKWAIYNSKSLKSLKNSINNLFIFFEFIENEEESEYRKKIVQFTDNRYKNSLIKKDDIILFLSYCKKQHGEETLNKYKIDLKSFISYLILEGEKIDKSILEYFKTKKFKSIGESTNIIPVDDLKKIAEEYKREMDKSIEGKLRWIFFHLLNTTNFRPNEILNLKRDCIVKGMKKGEYEIVLESDESSSIPIISMSRKTSHGKKIEVNPSKKTIRALEVAIELTKELSSEADSCISEYIFIKRVSKQRIDAITLDNMYRNFKRTLKKLKIPDNEYTLYSCRHTYMTNVFEKLELHEALIATGHDTLKTTKRYIHFDTKEYLEAMYKVSIGNVKLNGVIVDKIENAGIEIPNNINNITVKKGCGYCKTNCEGSNEIDCLICNNFIATLDRIPYFEQGIRYVDKLIVNEEIMHEKEHLVSIKKLYVAYLAELYRMKNEEG